MQVELNVRCSKIRGTLTEIEEVMKGRDGEKLRGWWDEEY